MATILYMPTGTSSPPSSPVTLNGGAGSTIELKTVTVTRISSQSAPVQGKYTPPKNGLPGSANVKLNTARWNSFAAQADSSFTASVKFEDDNDVIDFLPS